MIKNTTIQAVRDYPIEEVIGRYVDLKKVGAQLKACCPLHNEKTPSMTVHPAKNSFKCFGCGAGGDAIQFVMEHDNLPFNEAIISIATAHGIAIEFTESTQTPEQKNELDQMMQVLATAQILYRKQLLLTVNTQSNL